jgi:hypothetical protein
MIRENIPKIRDVAYCFSKVSACLAGMQSSCSMRIAGGSPPPACVCVSVFACARGRGGQRARAAALSRRHRTCARHGTASAVRRGEVSVHGRAEAWHRVHVRAAVPRDRPAALLDPPGAQSRLTTIHRYSQSCAVKIVYHPPI